MCGIIGAVAKENCVPFLMGGLRCLEYRGYDSSGIAVLNKEKKIACIRSVGKVAALNKKLNSQDLSGLIGIAHTRWATHGKPTLENAHPQLSSGEVAVVHNGIIENYRTIKSNLINQGYIFQSNTDTEVISHLIHQHYELLQDLFKATTAALSQLKGSFALVVMHKKEPDRLIGVRRGSPLIAINGNPLHFIASDPAVLTQIEACGLSKPIKQPSFIHLEENDQVILSSEKIVIYDKQGNRTERIPYIVLPSREIYSSRLKGDYTHHMQQEIFEQPTIINNMLKAASQEPIYYHKKFRSAKSVHMVACGTSYHAALLGSYWMEALTDLSARAEIASEFRYRSFTVPNHTLFIALSQSGETADTLAALNKAKQSNYLSTLAIFNVPYSSLMRNAEFSLITKAGLEISVASTKSFIAQILSLLLLTQAWTDKLPQALLTELNTLPKFIEMVFHQESCIQAIAHTLTQKRHVLFLGRGVLYPIALEGALKLKELAYIHAQAYPAGEIKHGPLALLDEQVVTIILLPSDHLKQKSLSTLEEIKARNVSIIVLTDDHTHIENHPKIKTIHLPKSHPLLTPFIYTVALQLLAYHTARIKGTDVDQPRHLAKSVTVE